MTLREAIGAEVGYNAYQLIEKIAIDRGLDPLAEYSAEMRSEVEICTAYVLRSLVNMPDYQEGSYNVKFDRRRALRRANDIFIKYGLTSEIQTDIQTKVL